MRTYLPQDVRKLKPIFFSCVEKGKGYVGMWGNIQLKQLKNAIFIKADDYDIQNLVLIHMLHITFTLSLISLFINPILGLPKSIIYSNIGSFFFIIFNYWIVRIKQHYELGRWVYLSFVMVMINFLWFESEGSAGPSLFYILAFVPMFIFLVETKRLKYGFIVIGLNVPILLLLEGYKPEWLTYYNSNTQRILDILIVCLVFVIFEIPLIIYVKNLVIQQRNSAKKSEQVKTRYITHLSHEIRTPMNAILGFSELLGQNDLKPEEQHDYINIINDNGHSLLNLLNNIINLSKIEDEQSKISLSSFSAYGLLKNVHSSLSYNAKGSSVDFSIESPKESDVMFSSDVVLVYQVISNLVFNALKFTHSGYVHMGFEAKNEHITFWVKDTGIGISQEKQSSIFNQFEQVYDHSQTLNLSGTGLGLTICKSLSKILHGQLTLESEIAKGSTFYFKLPLQFPS